MSDFPASTRTRWYMLATRPDIVLRAEAAIVLTVSLLAYGHWFPGHWLFFALLLLAPDVALIPYAFVNNWITAALYNMAHSYVLPLSGALLAWSMQSKVSERLAVIWIAHIAMDRLLGYGLKYGGEFKKTHLQRAAAL